MPEFLLMKNVYGLKKSKNFRAFTSYSNECNFGLDEV